MPVETVGECFQSSHCHQYRVDLADGLCCYHWDMTAP